MIYSLTGKISMQDDNTLVVDTGAIGFEVVCSTFTVYKMTTTSEPQTILTYLQTREDAMVLFGFADKKEKAMFNELLLVSGVGPKMAITILSGLPLDELVKAITNSDVKTLSSIKGLGKKTAERIVLELNAKLGGSGSLEDLISCETTASKAVIKREIEEAYDVLVSSGISKTDAIEIAKGNYKDGMTSEDLVLQCFKNMKK